MFHLVYYVMSFHCSSCLEGVPLAVFKKLGYCVDPMMLTHIQVLGEQGLCRLYIYLDFSK